MKVHEENKILALLNYLNFDSDESEKILDLIDNKNRSEEDLINLLENLNLED